MYSIDYMLEIVKQRPVPFFLNYVDLKVQRGIVEISIGGLAQLVRAHA